MSSDDQSFPRDPKALSDSACPEDPEEEDYTGTCFWCGLCAQTNGVCVRNNQRLLNNKNKKNR